MRRVSVTSLRGNSSPPSPSDPPRRDWPTRQISDFPPNSPDHALRFTAIRASERFRGRVALPALSGPLPRSAVTNASARNARHDAPRGPIRPRRQSTKRPASFPRRVLNSPSWTRTSNLAVNSRPLYRLSYRGMLGREGDPSESPLASQPSWFFRGFLRIFGGIRLPEPIGGMPRSGGRPLRRGIHPAGGRRARASERYGYFPASNSR